MKTTRIKLVSGWVACVLAIAVCAKADDKSKSASDAKDANSAKAAQAPAPATNSTTTAKHGYLGVSVEPLHEGLVGHLEHMIGKGRGVLVDDVAKDSPAEKAGIERNDILVSFDDQNLYSPEQLSKLIHHDQVGREVTLHIVRSGQQKQIKATLGEHQQMDQAANHGRNGMQRRMRFSHEPTQDSEAGWSTFDSMTLTRTDKDKFKAEIRYKNDQGKTDAVQFEGTREELRKDIEARKDLPASEREHLMRALNLTSGGVEFPFPSVFFIPDDAFWDDWR